jgi:hypothetical protein
MRAWVVTDVGLERPARDRREWFSTFTNLSEFCEEIRRLADCLAVQIAAKGRPFRGRQMLLSEAVFWNDFLMATKRYSKR